VKEFYKKISIFECGKELGHNFDGGKFY